MKTFNYFCFDKDPRLEKTFFFAKIHKCLIIIWFENGRYVHNALCRRGSG